MINPKWMVEDNNGQMRTSVLGFHKPHAYALRNLCKWTYGEIAQHYDITL